MTKKTWLLLGALLCVLICVAVVVCMCVRNKGDNPPDSTPEGNNGGEPEDTIPEITAEAVLAYTINADGASYTVTGVESKFVRAVTIPDTYQNLPVTAIADKLFEEAPSVSSVTIGKNVVTIGERAFYNCDGIVSLALPNSVELIGMEAFSCCDSLTAVTLGNGVREIGYAAFRGCTLLETLALPVSITFIAEDAFGGCNDIDGVHITDLAAWCAIKFQCASANPLSVVGKLYVNDALVTKLTIPASVTAIGQYAFYNMQALKTVTIHSEVRSIGAGAFANCVEMASATFAQTAEWWACETADANTGEEIVLSSSDVACECLTNTYKDYYWKRG